VGLQIPLVVRRVLRGTGVAPLRRAAVLAALVAGAVGAGPADAVAADPSVGHTVKQIVVQGSSSVEEQRKVDVHLWYPADPATASARPKAVYTSALHGNELIAPDGPWDPLSWSVEAERAREGAAVDPDGGPFAAIVFSHSATNDPIDYAHTLERIAAGGFIVAAPYHTNNTQDDVRRDFANAQAGTTVFPCQDGRPGPCSRGTNVPLSMADRVKDIDRILDQLPVWFGDRVDVGRAGVLGHSRGTVTALAAAGGTFPLTDERAATANCQGPTNRIVSPDGIARCWPLAPGMEFGLGRTQADQGNNRVGRIKAVMGMAIGDVAINRGVNLEKVAASTVLYRGALDLSSPPGNTLTAHTLIGSADKTLGDPDGELLDPLPGVGHRSFDSTYCDQTQAAAGSADKQEADRIGDGDGHVDAAEYEDWKARAILDFHTAAITLRGTANLNVAPPAIANFNSARQFCSSTTFTDPVNITSVVGNLTGAFDPADAPATGFVTSDTLKQQMADEAVDFFREKLSPAV
jgi:predicted dienelactone hydrolase